MKIIPEFKKRFNLLFLFSFGFIIGGVVIWISNNLYHDNFLVNGTLDYVNGLFESGILYPILLIVIVSSLVMNYSKSKQYRLEYPYNSALFLTGIDVSVMLFGTLTSLVFFLHMSFSNDAVVQAASVVAMVLVMIVNHQRPVLIERIANRLAKTK